LLSEGIEQEKVFLVGNTVVDAVHQNLAIAKTKSNLMREMGLAKGGFILATAHRAENVDDKSRFAGLIKGLQKVKIKFDLPLIYPIHPRAKKQLSAFGIDTSGLLLIEPLDYLNFLVLESMAKLVLTDSGGAQEETCILGVPCVTLRDNTERPETIEVGANQLAGTNPDSILKAAESMSLAEKGWANPFGNGHTGEAIIKILLSKVAST
jgi:UDP-N-acetylglucosamine 2-epimerase (non-hydrolysing)